MTRGKDGMSVAGRDAMAVHLHTIAREIFDVSGAGDTVLTALSIGMAVRGDIVDVPSIANIAAGIVVGKLGTAIVSPEKLWQAWIPTQCQAKIPRFLHYRIIAGCK